jgi:SAM-dependent methyltransferase
LLGLTRHFSPPARHDRDRHEENIGRTASTGRNEITEVHIFNQEEKMKTAEHSYVHGTNAEEQERLAKLNDMVNRPYLDFLRLKGTEKVLEVGCGLGILTSEVAKALENGNVFGVEYSPDQLRSARRTESNAHFIRADAHRLPFADDTFQVVYSRYVLEHVSDPAKSLSEMRRVLKPGGRVFSEENNIAMNLFYPTCPVYEKLWNDLGILQARLGGDAYIGKRLFALFREVGFRDVKLSISPEVHHYGSSFFDIWVDNTLKILQGAEKGLVEHGLAKKGEVTAAVKELEEFKLREDAATFFYWNRATGVK